MKQNKKKGLLLALVAVLLIRSTLTAQHAHEISGYADSVNAGLIAQDTMKKSPHRIAMANIGDAHIHIEYGSPGVRGRTIWGGLVAYDQVWCAGAHNATKISFSKAVKIGSTTVEAGTYGLFLIPHTDKFTFILNKNWDQHLADEYDQKDDILRMDIEPIAPAKMVQRLTYEVVETGKNQGELRFSWENKMIKVPVSL